MFKHLLVPVDGSDVSKKSLKKVAELAKADGAEVCEAYAKEVFKKAATALGTSIKAKTLHISFGNLAEGILEGAKKSKADVIVMASHKRTGITGILLGSETHEVIVHTKLPVLVLG